MVQLYVDGQFQSQVSHIPAYPLILDNGGSSDYRIDIGARTRKNNYFKGAIDDVRIYDRALSSEEVGQLYTVPEPATMILLGLGGLLIRKRK